MNNFKKHNNFGGGNFKKKNFGGFGGSNSDRKEMFKAVCNECGKEALVPFRPNGRKPVLCSDCFQKERNDENRSGNAYAGGSNRPQQQDRPRFGDRPNKPSFHDRPAPAAPQTNYKRDFEALNQKLDKILALLAPAVVTPVTAPVEDTLDAEIEALIQEVVAPVKKAPAKKKKAVTKKTK